LVFEAANKVFSLILQNFGIDWAICWGDVDREPAGVILAGKVTKLVVASNDVYTWTNKEMDVCRFPAGGCSTQGQDNIWKI